MPSADRGVALLRCAGFFLLLGAAVGPGLADRRPLTAADAIETSRLMLNRDGRGLIVSPSGKRYVLMLIRGDTRRDGVWAKILSGSLESTDAAKPSVVAEFFTHGRGGGFERYVGSDHLTAQALNIPTWINDEEIALFWEDGKRTQQVYVVNTTTRSVDQATHHPADVVQFSVASSGGLLYAGSVGCTSMQELARGRVVTADSIQELLTGCNVWDRRNFKLYLQSDRVSDPQPVQVQAGDSIVRFPPIAQWAGFSPSSRYAIIPTTLTTVPIPKAWHEYRPDHFKMVLAQRSENPTGPFARQLQQLVLLDVRSGSASPLWDAPTAPNGRVRVAWSPDEQSIAIGPTFFPTEVEGEGGKTGEGFAELELASRRVMPIPVPPAVTRRVTRMNWVGRNCINMELDSSEALQFAKHGTTWAQGECTAKSTRTRGPIIKVELRENLNEPPRLYAVDTRSGMETLLLDLNPHLTEQFSLGQVKWFEHVNKEGSKWEGRLYYPTAYDSAKRYPLVVQTHSFARRGTFSLYGREPGLGPGFSAYLAQVLSSRQFFVLHGDLTDSPSGRSVRDPQRTAIQIAALEETVDRLVSDGLVDRTRVGIMGYSASGWLVSYALAHSKFPYAAAIVDDNKDGSYFQAATMNWEHGLGEDLIGAPPFGDGLQTWLRTSPAFNAEKVKTPLLMSVTSPGMELGPWEMFTRLRHLKKPVELFIVADVEHGSHGLQNPQQLLSLQERSIDWWSFWLQDYKDPDPAKREQYAGWDELKRLHDHAAGSQ